MSEESVWIDDVSLQDMGIEVLIDSQDPMLPEMRNNLVTIPDRPGAYDFGAVFDVRYFNLRCLIMEKDHFAIKQKIRQINRLFLDGRGRPKELQLKFGDEPDVYYKVRLNGGSPVDRIAKNGFLNIPLIASDPYAYSVARQDEVTWGSTVVTFASTQFKMGHIGVDTVTVTGNTTLSYEVDGLEATPLIRLSGTGTNVRIVTNGRSFTVPNLSGTWVVDSSTYTVTRNGQNVLGLMQGEFLSFVEGQNNVVITGTNLNFSIYVDVRNKYM